MELLGQQDDAVFRFYSKEFPIQCGRGYKETLAELMGIFFGADDAIKDILEIVDLKTKDPIRINDGAVEVVINLKNAGSERLKKTFPNTPIVPTQVQIFQNIIENIFRLNLAAEFFDYFKASSEAVSKLRGDRYASEVAKMPIRFVDISGRRVVLNSKLGGKPSLDIT